MIDLSFPELLPDYEPHSVGEVYMIQWDQPALIIDISETIGLKLSAIACHESQIDDVKAVEARVWSRAAALGHAGGFAYGEGFDRVIMSR